jgi:hypothetical protein
LAWGDDMHYSHVGNGSDKVTWSFPVTPGRYRVATTWVPHSIRATDAPFTIFDGSEPLATFRVNQQLAPDDFTRANTDWEYLGGELNLSSDQLAVQLSDDADWYVFADAVLIERVGDLVTAPEIEVFDGSTSISDGDEINFGETPTNVAVDRQLTIRNVGDANLVLTPLDPASLPTGYSLVANFADTELSTGESTTFTLRLQSSTEGSFHGTIGWDTNDADENPFQLSLQGTVADTTPPSEVQVVDNGDSGFHTQGDWIYREHPLAWGDDMHYNHAGVGADVATWTFTVAPGRFRVATTWVPHSIRATDAPFEILSAGQRLAAVDVNQQQAPDDFSEAGVQWENLGDVLDVTSQQLVVRLSDNANWYVFADAVRIERVGDLPAEPDTLIVDNGDNQFSTSGQWTYREHRLAVGDDMHYSRAGTGSNVATWTFTVTPGRYRVATTWVAHDIRATNAPFAILDGTRLLTTVRINQQQTPDDFSDQGASWENLGDLFDVTGNDLIVRLSNDADWYVFADAVRVERVGDLLS